MDYLLLMFNFYVEKGLYNKNPFFKVEASPMMWRFMVLVSFKILFLGFPPIH
jgi:hypothetical protein